MGPGWLARRPVAPPGAWVSASPCRAGGPAVLFLVESVLLFVALAVASRLRLGLDEPIGGSLLAKGLAPVLALQLSLYYSELYDDRALRSRTQFFLRLAQSDLSAALILALGFFLVPGAPLGPGT